MPYNDNIQQNVILPFAELYEFTYTNGIIDKYTSYYKDVNATFGTYKSLSIQRTQFKTSSDIRENKITLSLYVADDLSKEFLEKLVAGISVKIIRYFLNDGSYKVIFSGFVSSVNVNFNVVSIQLQSLIGVDNKTVPVIHYQAQCNNSLYDNRCNVNKSLHKVYIPTGNLSKNSNTEFYATEIGTKPNDYFKWGVMECNGDFRLIINHTGNVINIQYAFDFDPTQYDVNIYAGCNKTISDCRNKFNNEENFLGFPYIPTKNPVIWGL